MVEVDGELVRASATSVVSGMNVTTESARPSAAPCVFVSPLVAPYVGTTTAVYGWFPSRYNIKDSFRMGNYSMLGYMGTNIILEFIPRKAISLLAKVHLNNRHGAPDTSSQQ